MYPRSGFWYRGTSAKTTLLETTLLRARKICLVTEHPENVNRRNVSLQNRAKEMHGDFLVLEVWGNLDLSLLLGKPTTLNWNSRL